MMYTKTLFVAATMLAAISVHPAQAEDIRSASPQVQIAEDIPAITPAGRRNVTAIRKTEMPAAADAAAGGVTRGPQPQGAQALMALGIALIVTPSMFAGAFSN